MWNNILRAIRCLVGHSLWAAWRRSRYFSKTRGYHGSVVSKVGKIQRYRICVKTFLSTWWRRAFCAAGSLIGVCLDGSAVGFGRLTGIIKRLSLEKDAVHCCAHVNALMAKHAEDSVQQFAVAQELLKGIATDFWSSPKKAAVLRDRQDALGTSLTF